MKNKKIKWLRILTVITFPLWIVPLILLCLLGFVIVAVTETIQDIYNWCIESEPKPVIRYKSIPEYEVVLVESEKDNEHSIGS